MSYSKNLKHKKRTRLIPSPFCVLSKNALKLNKNISIPKGETPLTSLSYINNFDLSTLFLRRMRAFILLIFYYRLCQRTAPPAVTTTKIVEVIFLVLRRIKKQRCALTFENRPETADLTLAIIRIERTFRFDFLQFYLSFAFVSIPLHTSFLCNPKRPYIARSEFTIIYHFRLCVIGRKQKYHFAPPISE